jgi:hypothetical protein
MNPKVRVTSMARSAIAWVLMDGGGIDIAPINCKLCVRKLIWRVVHVQFQTIVVLATTEQVARMGAK